jgi:hypothetical protein
MIAHMGNCIPGWLQRETAYGAPISDHGVLAVNLYETTLNDNVITVSGICAARYLYIICK